MNQKDQLRARMRRVRRELDRREERSLRVVARLWQLPEMQSACAVTFYLNVRDEVATRSAVELAWERQIRVAIPYCLGETLRFAEVRRFSELECGAFGVMEPVDAVRKKRPVDVQELDALVVPGLAFDSLGGRLGYGRGYYDRALSQRRVTSTAIGLAFDCQCVDEVPRATHDQCVDAVVTESYSYRVERR